MTKNKNKGKFFENIASKYLTNKGYKIISKNIYSKLGEIDIIATKDNKLIIVEVKGGKLRYQNINKNKIIKIINTLLIKESTLKISEFKAIQIDIVFVDETHKIEHIENIIL